MARPYWSGQIQISLVSFGVKLFVATEAKSEIRFHQISRSTGERVRYQKVQASAAEQQEATGEDTSAESRVDKNDIVKGYEYRKGEYVTVEPEELAHLRVPSKHTISLDQFVKLTELPPAYLEKPYFIVPESDAQTEAFATVREALRKENKAGLGKIAFGGREHVFAIAASDDKDGGGLMGFTLRYKDELRDGREFFSDIKKAPIAEDSLSLAMELIKRKTKHFDPSSFTDSYETALKELIEAKVQHMPVPQEEAAAPQRGKVVNLMDALRRSVSGGDEAAEQAKPAARGKGAPATRPAATPSTAAKKTASRGLALVGSDSRKPPKSTATGNAKSSSGKGASKRRSA